MAGRPQWRRFNCKPAPQTEQIDPAEIEIAITDALALANEKSIRGKALTPFLLEQIRHITNGDSLNANKALVRNNAELAADIAVAMTLNRVKVIHQSVAPIIRGCYNPV